MLSTNAMGEKRFVSSNKIPARGGLDHEVNKYGWAGWQGNKISSKETTRGTLHRQVNKKSVFLPVAK